MKADAILRVTQTISKRLEDALGAGAGSVFVGPLDDPNVGNAELILFLYRVAPSCELRNSERRVPSRNGGVDLMKSSLPLDLHFLLTVGSNPGGPELSKLQGLGVALQCLQQNPDFVGSGVNHEPVRVTLDSLGIDEMSRIWNLFPGANYRTSVAYVVTPVWIDPELPEPSGIPVVADQLFSGPRTSSSGESNG
jgi:hypothetical protein